MNILHWFDERFSRYIASMLILFSCMIFFTLLRSARIQPLIVLVQYLETLKDDVSVEAFIIVVMLLSNAFDLLPQWLWHLSVWESLLL